MVSKAEILEPIKRWYIEHLMYKVDNAEPIDCDAEPDAETGSAQPCHSCQPQLLSIALSVCQACVKKRGAGRKSALGSEDRAGAQT
jgi:hypothetical protein